MQRSRAYRTKSMRRRTKDIVRPKDILAWWQEAHGYLSADHQRTFLRHPATRALCGYPLLSVRTAVSVEIKLDNALARVQRLTKGSAPADPGAMPPRDQPHARSTWLGGDVQDEWAEQRRAAERRLARPDVDRPEPYL
ncbi:MAG: hypothetical protein GC156_11680 [Actinomycetales bacterium]|nr:hypothetical protein [Actinomycetales bacterium]